MGLKPTRWVWRGGHIVLQLLCCNCCLLTVLLLSSATDTLLSCTALLVRADV